jgi:hypothetical protein
MSLPEPTSSPARSEALLNIEDPRIDFLTSDGVVPAVRGVSFHPNLENLHTARRITPISGEHLV